MKGREREGYTKLNAKFQRIARKDKVFFSEQYKEIKGKNRMGRTRDPFKNIRDTKGTFHALMGTIKDRNCMDLTEAEDIKKRWHEYTEELYKKCLNDLGNHSCVVIHLEPDVMKCEVKWDLGCIFMNKARESDGIQAKIFQILKGGAVKILHLICQ